VKTLGVQLLVSGYERKARPLPVRSTHRQGEGEKKQRRRSRASNARGSQPWEGKGKAQQQWQQPGEQQQAGGGQQQAQPQQGLVTLTPEQAQELVNKVEQMQAQLKALLEAEGGGAA
jgi:hypothetical protein